MTTKNIGSVDVVTELSYGSIDGLTGLPTPPVAGWNPLEIADRAQIITPGDLVMAEHAGDRAGGWVRPPEVTAVGSEVKRTAKASLTVPLRGPMGSNPALRALLKTCMDELSAQATPSDLTVAPVTSTSHATANAARYVAGAIAGYVSAGVWDWSGIESVAAGVVKLTYELAATPSAGATVRLPYSYSLPAQGMPTTSSAALRMVGDGWTAYGLGAVVEKLTLVVDEASRRVSVTLDLDIAHVQYEETGTPAVTAIPTGHQLHQLQSEVSIAGARAEGAAIDSESRENATCADAVAFEVTFTRAMPGCGATILGRASAEVVNWDATLTLTPSEGHLGGVPPTTDDMIARKVRQVFVGFGSGTVGAAGEGGCLWLPAGVLTSDPAKREAGKDYLRRVWTFKAGRASSQAGAALPSLVLAVGA